MDLADQLALEIEEVRGKLGASFAKVAEAQLESREQRALAGERFQRVAEQEVELLELRREKDRLWEETRALLLEGAKEAEDLRTMLDEWRRGKTEAKTPAARRGRGSTSA